jgi:GT2 family glycosyltransferase/2-polyprenyl-3-methyl-5-hydroxy-6-metoxy-1,4-benzoquinol methylase/glycosyltransferase involved in cell wall biosynthesis
VNGSSQDSLSIIAGLIEPGQTILDLGMGAGGLGQFLSQRQLIVADGVSLNLAEAEIARSWYRQALVADLDRDDLTVLFAGQQYDCIVCADVLEHLKAPQNVLAQCKALLKPGGRLLTSVPNAGYCGLVAELIQGDFRYRPEGLLDSTHLRFFTRTSLQRFFSDNEWATQTVMATQRNLLESEFRVAFDSLPPAVARHLLSMPDALTYQFISVSQPAGAVDQAFVRPSISDQAAQETPASAKALFSAQLYLATGGAFDEATKLVVPGRIGDPLQMLAFDIAPSAVPYSRLRFDPADRPGFFRLHYLQIRKPDGQLIWQWQAGEDSLTVLGDALQHEILMSSPWETSAGALLLLHGDDPWIELPLAPEQLLQISEQGARLEVLAGWPMSADYLQASATINAFQEASQQSSIALGLEVDRLNHDHVENENARRAFQQELSIRQLALQEAQREKYLLIEELRAAQRESQTHRRQHSEAALYLQTIQQSSLFRATRPLVHLKMRIDSLLGQKDKYSLMPQVNPTPLSALSSGHPVDVIVPVFRGLEDTRMCLESVLRASCESAWRLIVINDCSPEPEVTEWLRVFARRDSRIELLENPENLGFVATVNRGMALSSDRDVLLLNSDAEVANDWLDRIQRAAYSRERVASVTPFSNNATICSYPRFCQGNDLPAGHDTASLDKLFARHLAGQAVEVPTGVGFCMYIRRECLVEVGLFDVENFGKGYGEENDFCIRAERAGWVNLHALDTFVRHAGGVSFGESKNARELQAMETMRRLHPRYESDVHAFVQRDPARSARLRIDLARIVTTGRPVVLNVIHNREGGTLRHVRELAQQLGGLATFLSLAPAPGGVELRIEGQHEGLVLRFSLPDEHHHFLQTLVQLQVGHIHYHHLLGHAPSIADLPGQLGVTHDFTAHDYYSYCPQVSLTDHTDRYCGELGLDQCHQCLKRNPAPGGESIESWRDRHARLLGQARYLIAPSGDVAQRMQRFVPIARIEVLPHALLNPLQVGSAVRAPRLLPEGQPLKIVVLGALSKIKGADVLEEIAMLAARQNVPLEFHLLGYAYRSLRTQPKARLTVHGGYEEKDLPLLLQWLKPDAVWFPAQCPETYSYTLSASLESGLPIIAPNIGAFAERLQKRDWVWLCDWRQSATEWLEFFKQIRQENFCSAIAPDPVPNAACFAPLNPHLALTYHGAYVQSLPLPKAQDTDELVELQYQIAPNQRLPGTTIKSTVLRAILRMRASRTLSPLTRMVPMHMQRRLKSWLGA